jgi:hypothetical protein
VTTTQRRAVVVAALAVVAMVSTVRSPGELLAHAPASSHGAVGNAAASGPSAEPGPPTEPPPMVDIPVAGGGTVRASSHALADIPSDYLAYYVHTDQTMARHGCPSLTWQLLAGIGKVESDHGRSPAPGVRAGLNRFGCCAGPMQFNLVNGPPSTWYGIKRPGDSPYDPADAIPAAGRKLCNDGLGAGDFAKTWAGKRGGDPCPQVRGYASQHRALRRYNNACWYAHQVLAITDRYTRPTPNPALAGPRDPFVAALVANTRITTTASRGCDPKPDLASGRLDLRVQALLAALTERWTIRISCARTGHSRFVNGTNRLSNHTVWRAIDLDVIDGEPVSRTNHAARELVAWIDKLSGPLRPTEVGSPFSQYAARPMYFSDDGHQAHIHIGYGHDPATGNP